MHVDVFVGDGGGVGDLCIWLGWVGLLFVFVSGWWVVHLFVDGVLGWFTFFVWVCLIFQGCYDFHFGSGVCGVVCCCDRTCGRVGLLVIVFALGFHCGWFNMVCVDVCGVVCCCMWVSCVCYGVGSACVVYC